MNTLGNEVIGMYTSLVQYVYGIKRNELCVSELLNYANL